MLTRQRHVPKRIRKPRLANVGDGDLALNENCPINTTVPVVLELSELGHIRDPPVLEARGAVENIGRGGGTSVNIQLNQKGREGVVCAMLHAQDLGYCMGDSLHRWVGVINPQVDAYSHIESRGSLQRKGEQKGKEEGGR